MTVMSPAGAVPSLHDLLERAEHDLLSLQQRLYVLEAFVEELERVSRGKESKFWNDSLWLILLDTRDMLVVHLASWARGVYRSGGLLGQVQAHLRVSLPLHRTLTERDQRDLHYSKLRDEFHAAAVQRLFPNATGALPAPADVEALKTAFIDRMKPVVEDRDRNRAHPYERGVAKQVAKMLDLGALRALVDYGQQLLNDFRLLSADQTLGYADLSFTDARAFALDLVEQLLTGTSGRRSHVMAGRDREKFYADQHSKHDALGSDTKLLWNDNLED